MILVDTSVIVPWLDMEHEHHAVCRAALLQWAGEDHLAVSAVTYAELAAGGRTREWVDDLLSGFARIELDFEAAFRAGQAFRQCYAGKAPKPVLPDFFIRAQAALLGVRHLTNDRRRLQAFPEVEFLFP
jgi:predicted nucleic acid-binding protein